MPNATTPDRRGLGAPVSRQEIEAREIEESRQAQTAARKPAPPPVPYRANTTGINTRNLPKPPTRSLTHQQELQVPTPASAKPKPSLPPRLPARQNSHPNLHTPDPPPPYAAATQQDIGTQNDEYNVGALSRLGKAGVSVPGFGIGSKPQDSNTDSPSTNPWASETSGSTITNTTSSAQNASLGGLQSRFAKLSTTSPPPADQGTTMQQKQDTLRIASAFHKDPSSISLSDAKATAETANNFRERHGEQVATGGRWAGAMNKKYDIAGKVNGYTSGSAGGSNSHGQTSPSPETNLSPWANEPSAGHNATLPLRANAQSPTMGGFKKAPPPPPPQSRPTGPPPIPVGSKPKG